jgi:hypothetical protein
MITESLFGIQLTVHFHIVIGTSELSEKNDDNHFVFSHVSDWTQGLDW